MDQLIVLWGIAVLVFIGFVLYPRLMFGVLGALIRGLFGLLMDAVALLFTWI